MGKKELLVFTDVGVGEQWGQRKVCADLQGAVGLVSPGGWQQWEGAVFCLKEMQVSGICMTVMPTVCPALLSYTETIAAWKNT